jgi:hypothetical protein
MVEARFTLNVDALKGLEAALGQLYDYTREYNGIIGRAAKRLTPDVRAFLLSNLRSSGLKLHGPRSSGNKTMRLEDMIRQAVCFTTSKGIVVTLPRGFSNSDYQKANALQYGAIRGNPVKNSKSRSKIKKIGEIQFNQSGGKDRKVATGISYLPAHPYFTLTPGQVAELNMKLNVYIEDEYNQTAKKIMEGAA